MGIVSVAEGGPVMKSGGRDVVKRSAVAISKSTASTMAAWQSDLTLSIRHESQPVKGGRTESGIKRFPSRKLTSATSSLPEAGRSQSKLGVVEIEVAECCYEVGFELCCRVSNIVYPPEQKSKVSR